MSLKLGGQEIPFQTAFLVASEGLLIVSVLLLTACFHPLVHGAVIHTATWHDLPQIALVAFICELCLYYSDMYELTPTGKMGVILVRLLESFGIACLLLAGVCGVLPRFAASSGVALAALPLITVLLFAWRLILDRVGVMKMRGESALVLGTGATGIAAVREVCVRPELNLRVVGFLDSDPKNVGKPLVNPGIVATIDDLEQTVARYKVGRVIIAPSEKQAVPVSKLLRLKFSGIVLEDAGALLERITGRIAVHHETESRWLMLSDGFRQSRVSRAIKRTLDILGALALLGLYLPLMFVVALAIVWETGFPVIFRQVRVGLDGKTFQMWKFRSMVKDAEAKGPSWTADNDLRITKVGRFIRKYRLDELPQIWNVLRGDMSLVGPRPEQPHFCDLLEKQIPFFEQRQKVRPGITGWAQIKYRYAGSVDDAKMKLEFDMFYIKHRSLLLDVAILMETVRVVLFARGSK